MRPASRTDRGLIAAAVFGAAILCAPLAVPAQQPTPLAPAAEPAPASPFEYSSPTDAPGIEIGELATIDPDSGGMLEESMGGFGVEMWTGTSRATILTLLPQLAAGAESPTMQDLARRLLLSTAIAPVRAPDDPQTSLIGIRVERLEAMGLVGAVADMIAIAPNRDTDPHLLRAAIDNRLLLDDVSGACDMAAAGKSVLTDTYGEQIAVFCQAVRGDREAASFSAGLLRDAGTLDDPVFFALADALMGTGKVKIASLKAPTPLHLAMARAVKAKLPADVLGSASPLILRALADHPGLGDPDRLTAAEAAARAGAIGPRDLAAHYAAVAFTPTDLGKALSRADGKRGPVERALLYQAEGQQTLPVAQASVLQKALRTAMADGIYPLTVQVYLPVLERLQPAAELNWFAADAARALLVAGRADLAATWAAAPLAPEDAGQQKSATLLWPLLRLAEGPARGMDESGHDSWLTALGSDDPAANRRVALAYGLMQALDDPQPDRRWLALLRGAGRVSAQVPDLAYLRAFRQAAAAGRKAETVLLALLVLGQDGVAGMPAGSMAEIVDGLNRVDLGEEARRLAIEAALASGL